MSETRNYKEFVEAEVKKSVDLLKTIAEANSGSAYSVFLANTANADVAREIKLSLTQDKDFTSVHFTVATTQNTNAKYYYIDLRSIPNKVEDLQKRNRGLMTSDKINIVKTIIQGQIGVNRYADTPLHFLSSQEVKNNITTYFENRGYKVSHYSLELRTQNLQIPGIRVEKLKGLKEPLPKATSAGV